MNRYTHLLFRLLVIAFPFLAAGSRNPRITGIALVVGNLLPLFGVLFFDWSVMEILWIYWAESAIIGILNLVAMGLAISHSKSGVFQPVALFAMLPLGAFFCAHFGGFMAGHAVFLTFMPEIAAMIDPNARELMGSENIFALLGCPPAGAACGAADLIGNPIAIGVAGLIGSHGVSFFIHFIGGKEYYSTQVMVLFGRPYTRIVLMHLTIIIGAFALVLFSFALPGQGIATLAGVWVVLKIIVDLRAHQKVHAPAGPAEEDGPTDSPATHSADDGDPGD